MTLPGFTAEASFAGRHYRALHGPHAPTVLPVTPQLRAYPGYFVCNGVRRHCEGRCLEQFVWDLDTSDPGPALDGYAGCMQTCLINYINCTSYGEIVFHSA